MGKEGRDGLSTDESTSTTVPCRSGLTVSTRSTGSRDPHDTFGGGIAVEIGRDNSVRDLGGVFRPGNHLNDVESTAITAKRGGARIYRAPYRLPGLTGDLSVHRYLH